MRTDDDSFDEDQVETQLAVDIAVLQRLASDLGGSAEADDAKYARTNADLLVLLRERLDQYLEHTQQNQQQFAAVMHHLSSSFERAGRARIIPTEADDVPARASEAGALIIRLPRKVPGLVLVDTGTAPALVAGWSHLDGTVQLLQGKPVGTLHYERDRDAATLDVAVWWSASGASLLSRAGRTSPSRSVAASDRQILECDARTRVATMWSSFTDIGVQIASDAESRRTIMDHAVLHGVEFR